MVRSSSDPETERLRFVIRLVVRHPTIEPAAITDEFGLEPHLAHAVGTDGVTPIGTKLPWKYKESIWGWSKHVRRKRAFFDEVAKLALKLEKHQQFISALVAGGGTITAIVDLPGDENIGSVMSAADIRRLANLEIDLGIEVFPKWND